MERADTAVVAVRRAMTNGSDPDAAIRELLTAATELADAHGATDVSGSPPATVDTHPEVTERVTESVTGDATGTMVEEENEVTAEPLPQSRELPKAVEPTEVVDPDTVRLERSQDFEWTGTWLVLSGTENSARLVGYLQRPGKKWQALGPNLTAVRGSVCQTRKAALLRLLDPHVPRR